MMNASDLLRAFTLLAVVPVMLTAQVSRERDIPLKNWEARRRGAPKLAPSTGVHCGLPGKYQLFRRPSRRKHMNHIHSEKRAVLRNLDAFLGHGISIMSQSFHFHQHGAVVVEGNDG